MNFRDYEAQVMAAQKGPKFDPVECKTCKSQYFEQLKVTKFDSNLTVAPNQTLASPWHEFTVLRCARCMNLQEVPANYSGWDRTAQDRYTDMITELEKPVVKDEKK